MATEMTRSGLARALAELIHQQYGPVSFHALEIGAAPIEGHPEPFHQLLDLFPGSRITAFEVDDRLCRDQNAKARPGVRFYPVILGRAEEMRTLHITADPLCSSLYEPNVALIQQYCHMDAARPVSSTTVMTSSLDGFARSEDIRDIDFIKIDVQGGELDVFAGGQEILGDAVMIVTEVEFVRQYVGQPLFGDISAFLEKFDFMFQNFQNIGRRSLLPFVVDDPNKGAHFIWADALFSRDIRHLQHLTDDKLAKMAVLATLYGSEDLAYRCLHVVDDRRRTGLSQHFVAMLKIGT
jgi:FkbM family methyltransferase